MKWMTRSFSSRIGWLVDKHRVHSANVWSSKTLHIVQNLLAIYSELYTIINNMM